MATKPCNLNNVFINFFTVPISAQEFVFTYLNLLINQ